MQSRRESVWSGALAACMLLCLAADAVAESKQTRDLRVDFSAGVGLGGRAIERPILGGSQRIGPGHFPVADLAVRAWAWPQQSFSLGFLLRYQTTLIDTAWEHPPLAQGTELHVRSHHVELSTQPMWRGAADSSWGLGASLGYAMRVFWPDVHNLQTPRQFITGPLLRPELSLTGLGPFSIRLGPELFWVLTLDHTLRSAVGDRQGLALGGQVSIVADLGEDYALELMYRESHVLLIPEFHDIERFLTSVVTRKF